MSIKSLPIRAPLSKVAPRRRTPVERIMGAVEAATAVRALTRLTGKKRRTLPGPVALAALGGGLAAIAAGVILARKRSSGGYEPPASMTPSESGTSANGDSPDSAASGVDGVQVPVVAPGADPEGAKLDVDAPNEGATGDHPA